MSEDYKKIENTLGRIETKLDQLFNTMDDHEKRLRIMERSLWIASGIVLLIGYIIKFKGN